MFFNVDDEGLVDARSWHGSEGLWLESRMPPAVTVSFHREDGNDDDDDDDDDDPAFFTVASSAVDFADDSFSTLAPVVNKRLWTIFKEAPLDVCPLTAESLQALLARRVRDLKMAFNKR